MTKLREAAEAVIWHYDAHNVEGNSIGKEVIIALRSALAAEPTEGNVDHVRACSCPEDGLSLDPRCYAARARHNEGNVEALVEAAELAVLTLQGFAIAMTESFGANEKPTKRARQASEALQDALAPFKGKRSESR